MSRFGCHFRITLAALPFLQGALQPTTLYADLIVLTSGTTLDGEIIEETADGYRIRTVMSIVDIEKDRVAKITKLAPPWKRYQKKLKKAEDTVRGNWEMAEWCRKNNLAAERRFHLERILVLDPDHAEAHRALGYTRSGDKWSKSSADAATDDDREALRQQREEEKLVRQVIAKWFVKVKAIYRGKLDSSQHAKSKSAFRSGRDQILAIRDPLAIPAITGVLSTGDAPVRQLLIESLSEFPEDEATMNLIVMTVLDPTKSIRREAALAISKRKDPRATIRLRDALGSDDEFMLRNAATALGILKANEAVEQLIDALSTESRQLVRVSRPVYLDNVYGTYGHYTRVLHGRQMVGYQPGGVGCMGPGTFVGTATDYEMQTVSIYRTEVQEALIAITGQNFGFDRDQWRQWWRQGNPAKP